MSNNNTDTTERIKDDSNHKQYRSFRKATLELAKDLESTELSTVGIDIHADKAVAMDDKHAGEAAQEGMAVETSFQYMIAMLLALQGLIIILFATCTKDGFIDNFTDVYQMFTGVGMQ